MIPRDDDIIEVIVSKCRDWWTRYIIGNETPPIENPPSLEVCKRIKRIPDKTIELPESVTGLIEQWETSKAEKKVAEEKEESLKSRLILSLGDADGGYLKDGRLLSFMEQTKKEFISKQVTFRVLRVKKRK